MKKLISILSVFLILIGFVSCSKKEEGLSKRQDSFYGTFDTQISYLSYTQSDKEFEKEFNLVKSEYERLTRLFDNYHSFEGVKNVFYLNQNASKEPVKVDDDLFNVIRFSIDNYEKTGGKLNIGMGLVLDLWKEARDFNGEVKEEDRIIPSDDKLKEAGNHMDIKNIILDEKEKTVFLKDPMMKLDLGSIGKGYATELVAKELEESGVKHASINAGGNVRTIGNPGDGRNAWGIAIENPNPDQDFLEVLYLGQTSVVTSGDYQRYFEKDGKRYHHIIDAKTLKPAGEYKSVSIITEDSGLADYLSTVIFLSSKEEAKEILKNYPDVKVLWYNDQEGVTSTKDLEEFMKSKGANRN